MASEGTDNLSSSADGVIPAGALVGEKKDTGLGGTRASWALVDASGAITELDFSLPLQLVRTASGADLRFVVKLPQIAIEKTAMRAIAWDYFTAGHTPPGVYDTPHWEFHLSALTEAETQTIDCTDQTPPDPTALPDGYIADPPIGVPLMGVHAFEKATPEFNGQRFSISPRLLAFWKGRFSQLEPKVSNDWLLARASATFAVPELKKLGLGAPTLFPRTLEIRYVAEHDTYVYRYTDLVMKQ